jgi:hypothetical protein
MFTMSLSYDGSLLYWFGGSAERVRVGVIFAANAATLTVAVTIAATAVTVADPAATTIAATATTAAAAATVSSTASLAYSWLLFVPPAIAVIAVAFVASSAAAAAAATLVVVVIVVIIVVVAIVAVVVVSLWTPTLGCLLRLSMKFRPLKAMAPFPLYFFVIPIVTPNDGTMSPPTLHPGRASSINTPHRERQLLAGCCVFPWSLGHLRPWLLRRRHSGR